MARMSRPLHHSTCRVWGYYGDMEITRHGVCKLTWEPCDRKLNPAHEKTGQEAEILDQRSTRQNTAEHSPVMRSTAYIHNSQCFFNISFVSCKNTLVLDQVPRASRPSAALCFSCSLARINTADSGTRALTQAENIEMPLAVQNRVRHVFPASGTKRKLMHAASR